MRRIVLLSTAALVLLAQVISAQPLEDILHPEIEPRETGYLQVSDLHTLYYELVGDPDGVKVIFLHGGPGGGISPMNRRFFDPGIYNVLLFDQRGAGKSKPQAEWRENTTQLLIEDINKLREHLGFTEPVIIFGGSWGSTLAVAYAESYPESVRGLVLRGVFLGSKAEIDHFYHGGVKPLWPENFARLQGILPNPEKHNYPEQLFTMITSGDEQTREKAVYEWARYEIRMVSLDMTEEFSDQILAGYDATPFSLLENWYMMNGCFLEDEELLRNAEKIADIPVFITNGRFDMICPPITALALAEKLDNVKVVLPVSAHSFHEPPMASALLEGLEWVREAGENR